MVQKQIVTITLEDDIDGSKATETIQFGLDGRFFEIDLNSKNAKKLREALEPFTRAGRDITRDVRKTTARSPRKNAAKAPTGIDSKAIRAWAAENGHEVPRAGRIPGAIITAYKEAHAA